MAYIGPIYIKKIKTLMDGIHAYKAKKKKKLRIPKFFL